VPNGEDKPAREARQPEAPPEASPEARQPEAPPPAPQPEAHDGAATLEGAGDLSASARQRRKMPKTVMTWGWVDEPQPFPTGGRPSSRDLVRAEAQRRLDSGEVPATIKEFGNALSTWLAATHSDAPSMVAPVVERCVRDLWRATGR
jgi:hypothetical protein